MGRVGRPQLFHRYRVISTWLVEKLRESYDDRRALI
jgi:hypothetical protein